MVDLSMTILTFSEEDDDEMDELASGVLCEDCGDPDTGYCFCVHIGMLNEKIDEYRVENVRLHRERAVRQNIRKVRRRIMMWQRWVRLHLLILYWREAVLAPESKAVQRAAKRFRAMASECHL